MPNEYSGRPTEGGLFCEGHREAHFHMPTHKFRVGQLVQSVAMFPAALSVSSSLGIVRLPLLPHLLR